MIGKGKNWARITFLILCIIGILLVALVFILPDAAQLLAPLEKLLTIIGAVLIVIAQILLFQQPSSDWFRHINKNIHPIREYKEQSQRSAEWEQACREGEAEARLRAAQARKKHAENMHPSQEHKEQTQRKIKEQIRNSTGSWSWLFLIGIVLIGMLCYNALKTNPSPVPAPSTVTPQIQGSGTGFYFTRNGFLATNNHVVQGGSKFTVHDPKRKTTVWARVVITDPANDLAILQADNTTSVPIPLAASFSLKRLEDIMTLGYPNAFGPYSQGMQIKATTGQINAISGPHDDPRFTQVDLPIQPGNSGGPLIDNRGNVVGIVTGQLRGSHQNVNYALKVDFLQKLISQNAMVKKALPRLTAKGRRDFMAIVEEYEDSVVMVLNYK